MTFSSFDSSLQTRLNSLNGSCTANCTISVSVLDDSITSSQLAANAVTTAKIANFAVTGAKIAGGALDQRHFNIASIPASAIPTEALAGPNSGMGASPTAKSTPVPSGANTCSTRTTASPNPPLPSGARR